ncbi:MAG: N-acetylmuramate/N-acetylglucosamine kinase [Syntrophus sp. SKADARSKE-3]|nr:N-acetylmuramate/N-acetylglucosamine kinase [Syntrophus sp. SKADARSKE-3]
MDELIRWAITVMAIPDSVAVTATPVVRGGSDRTFYRLIWANGRAMVMHYSREKKENTYFVTINGFLHSIGVAVPAILGHEMTKGFIAMEDLGDDDLWSHRFDPWPVRRDLYRKTLSAISRLHAYDPMVFPVSDIPLMEGFDEALYRWERDYFRNNFVDGVCGMSWHKGEAKALEAELDALAARLLAVPFTLIHRDFQSQNIMLRFGDPVLIDFQGMRMGNPFYDIGSLLYDPYVTMTEDERTDLLACYNDLSRVRMDWSAFLDRFRDAAAQRLMQALGAYGFLGLKKGRKAFLGHMAPGLANLLAVTAKAVNLPILHEVALRCSRSAMIARLAHLS